MEYIDEEIRKIIQPTWNETITDKELREPKLYMVFVYRNNADDFMRIQMFIERDAAGVMI